MLGVAQVSPFSPPPKGIERNPFLYLILFLLDFDWFVDAGDFVTVTSLQLSLLSSAFASLVHMPASGVGAS